MNDEMNNIDEVDLINEVDLIEPKKTLDLVIPLGTGATWNLELKYVLRSWAKYCENLGKVFLVGKTDKIKARYPWLKKVVIVDCDDPFSMNKDGNIIRKVIKVIDTQEVSDPFIRASDDQFLLKKTDSFPPMYSQDLAEKPREWWAKGSRWKNRLKRTHRILWVKGKPVFNYEVHFPLETGHDFKQVMERYPYTKSIGYTINTLYFNNALTEHTQAGDIRTMFEKPIHDKEEIAERLKGKTFLCYVGKTGDVALTPALKDVIMNKFKKKSKFER